MPAGNGAVITSPSGVCQRSQAEIDDVGTDRQILHHETRVAFEAGAPRWGQCDSPFFVNRKLRPRTASHALSLATASRWLRLGPPLHAARLQVRPTRDTLEPRNLVAQRRYHSLQLDYLLTLFDNQALQFGMGQTVKIMGR